MKALKKIGVALLLTSSLGLVGGAAATSGVLMLPLDNSTVGHLLTHQRSVTTRGSIRQPSSSSLTKLWLVKDLGVKTGLRRYKGTVTLLKHKHVVVRQVRNERLKRLAARATKRMDARVEHWKDLNPTVKLTEL